MEAEDKQILDIMNRIRDNLYNLMKLHNYSYRTLGLESDLGKTNINDFIRGNKSLDLASLIKIAIALNMDIADVVKLQEIQYKRPSKK